MAETIKTPFGTVSKKQAMIGGAVIGAIVLFVVYRARQNAVTSDGEIPPAEINPATGYAYGSAEDAAALAAQGNYEFAGSGGGGGSSSGNTSIPGAGFTNNAEWSQAVVRYMTDNSLVEDPAVLSNALGKYLGGKQLTDGEESLVLQALAAEGKPPVAGSDGYPPSIRKLPTGTPSTSTPLPAPTNLHTESISKESLVLLWNAVPGALFYQAQSTVPLTGVFSSQVPRIAAFPLHRATTYKFHVRAIGADGKPGPWSSDLRVTTKS